MLLQELYWPLLLCVVFIAIYIVTAPDHEVNNSISVSIPQGLLSLLWGGHGRPRFSSFNMFLINISVQQTLWNNWRIQRPARTMDARNKSTIEILFASKTFQTISFFNSSVLWNCDFDEIIKCSIICQDNLHQYWQQQETNFRYFSVSAANMSCECWQWLV